MKYLFLTIGPQASGKSSWLKENELDLYTISPDKIRLMFDTPKEGKISQENEHKVWNLVKDLLKHRMSNGLTTIIDATHSKASLVNTYSELAKLYRYRIMFIDFRNTKTLEQLKEDNKRGYTTVSEEALENTYHRLQLYTPPKKIPMLSKYEALKLIKGKIEPFKKTVKNIAFIGDIHSAYDELKQLVETIQSKYEPNETELVFLGDYFERGEKGQETLDYLLQLAKNHTVTFLEGNHERHIKSIILNEEVERECYKTLDPKKLKQLYNKFTQLYYIEHNNKKILATHAPQKELPKNILVDYQQLTNGSKKYTNIRDTYYNFQWDYQNIIQVHGHNNIYKYPVKNKNIYNINGNVEFGGALHSVVFSDREEPEIISINRITPYKEESHLLDTAKKTLDNKKYYQTKTFEGIDLVNYSLTKQKENEVYHFDTESKARGLYMRDDKVIGRGMNKILYLGQYPRQIIQNLKYPLTVEEKPNGFLLLIFEHNYEIVLATKNGINTQYTEWAREILKPNERELVKYLKENNTTLLIEIIDTKNDPHIIKYEKSHGVIIGEINNTLTEDQTVAPTQAKVLRMFDGEVKPNNKFTEKINSPEELTDFIEKVENGKLSSKKIEGYIVRDTTNNYSIKVKSKYYNYWKRVRQLKDQVYSFINKNQPERLNEFINNKYGMLEHVKNFIDNPKYKDMNIIEYRDSLK
jgi:2',3'-cyclic-nucleotide 3'-phosphodiesterase